MNDQMIAFSAKKPAYLRFSAREQALFAKRLAMILRSGVPPRDGLVMMRSGNQSSSARYLYDQIVESVSRGQTLSKSLAAFPKAFGPFSITLVRVGEATGMLHQNLDYLSEELKKKDALRKKVIGALIYPAVITLATVGISLTLAMYIFPKIMPIFASFKHQLPFTTRSLIFASNFLIKDWLFIALFTIIIAIAFPFLLRIESVKRLIDRAILRLPVFGTLAKSYNLANIARTSSLLTRGEVRIVAALEIVAESLGNSAYRESLRAAARSVQGGQPLSSQLQRSPRLFPPLMTQMVQVGEETGNLAGALMYVSDMYEEEISDLTKNLTTLLEPALMLSMGLIVGFIAISIIQPIYGITQDLTPH